MMTPKELEAIRARDAAMVADRDGQLTPRTREHDRRLLLAEVDRLLEQIEKTRTTVNDLQAFGLLRATDADQLLDDLKGDQS